MLGYRLIVRTCMAQCDVIIIVLYMCNILIVHDTMAPLVFKKYSKPDNIPNHFLSLWSK